MKKSICKKIIFVFLMGIAAVYPLLCQSTNDELWLHPGEIQTGPHAKFTTSIVLNSSKKIMSYEVSVTCDKSIMIPDLGLGADKVVEAGEKSFISGFNLMSTADSIGLHILGTDPDTHLWGEEEVLIVIHWKSLQSGTSPIDITVHQLLDVNSEPLPLSQENLTGSVIIIDDLIETYTLTILLPETGGDIYLDPPQLHAATSGFQHDYPAGTQVELTAYDAHKIAFCSNVGEGWIFNFFTEWFSDIWPDTWPQDHSERTFTIEMDQDYTISANYDYHDAVCPPEPTLPVTPIPTTEPTPFPTPSGIWGDVNGDGNVTIIDALLIAQHYVEIEVPDIDLSRADVSRDGTINIIDALIIARYYVGLEPVLPVEP